MTRAVALALLVASFAACGGEPPPQPAAPAAAAPTCVQAASPALSPASAPAAAAAAATPAAPAPLKDAYADVHGLKMHYLRQGSGPVLVMLHGGTASALLCWEKALPFFTPTFDVIAPEQMGHGGTADDPKRAFDYHAMAEDTVELLSQLGVTSASFIGLSDGGNIALDIAMHHPALVKKVVTTGANTTPDGVVPPAFKLLHDPKIKLGEHPFFADIRADYAKRSPDGAAHFDAFVERVRRLWTTQPQWKPKDLAAIKAPALIMAGEHDLVRLDHTMALAHAIPNAQLAILPGKEHEAMVDDAPFAWMVIAFLNAAPPKPAAP
jgi:pimeloyl-ACP methyl ester carboxylesterase